MVKAIYSSRALPIGVPDAVPKAIYKKETHGLANARGLVSAEITALELKKREALAWKSIVRPRLEEEEEEDDDDDDEGIQIYDRSPRRTTLIGESQDSTTITAALRPSPEQRRQASVPFFRPFPGDDEVPPPSTTPPLRLEDGGRGKCKRAHNERYE